jgi:hypothetical protein
LANVGDWNSELSYQFGDVVWHNGYLYMALNSTVDQEPLSGGQSGHIWQDLFFYDPQYGGPVDVGNRTNAEWNDSAPFGGEGNTPTCYTVSAQNINIRGTTDLLSGTWHVSKNPFEFGCDYDQSLTISGGEVRHEGVSGGKLIYRARLALPLQTASSSRFQTPGIYLDDQTGLGNGFTGYMAPCRTNGTLNNFNNDPRGPGQFIGYTGWEGSASFYPGCWEDWDNEAAYSVGDIVVHNLVFYRCIDAHTNQEPPNATYWLELPQ